MDIAPGTTLGEFRVVSQIGKGGMAIVYEALQTTLNRPVALKILPELSATSTEAVTRFHGEAEAGGRLSPPNIVQVFEIGRQNGHYFIAMELVRGRSLEQLLAETRKRLVSDTPTIDLAPSAPRTTEPQPRE